MLSQIEDFVNWARRRNPRARTWRDYSYDLRQFSAVVGDHSPGEITHRDIDRFVNSQVSSGYQPATVNRLLAAILALFTYLADEDSALVCPVLPRRHFLCQPQRDSAEMRFNLEYHTKPKFHRYRSRNGVGLHALVRQPSVLALRT